MHLECASVQSVFLFIYLFLFLYTVGEVCIECVNTGNIFTENNEYIHMKFSPDFTINSRNPHIERNPNNKVHKWSYV